MVPLAGTRRGWVSGGEPRRGRGGRAAASGGRSSKNGGGGWLHGAEAMGSSGEIGEMGKKRERRTAMLKKGEREPDVAGSGGIRRPTWGSGEEREAGFGFRIPAISGAGANGRERGKGAGDAAHARAWPTWPGRDGGVGAAAVSARRRAGIGGRWGKDPTGGPHLSATPREEAGGGCQAGPSACGRPSKEEGEEGGEWAGGPSEKKKEEKGREKKKKKEKDFPWN
uniref:Plant disease resistance polyprotein-like n=1 Tax=Oryza sativa subsp. japonica TaxID=39947 RepID=Q5Z547_ORYSJ|nr:plant disease resistance polyprotein-like [Oryza sativa Japonica Group]